MRLRRSGYEIFSVRHVSVEELETAWQVEHAVPITGFGLECNSVPVASHRKGSSASSGARKS